MKKNIPVSIPTLGEKEKKILNKCIDTKWISSDGPFVKKFEEKFSKEVDRKFGIAVTSGTAALDLAVLALDIKNGDEVIMPTFTIISCANAIIRAGAKPVLVDSSPETWNMDVSQIETKITKKTKAIMVVHIYGLPVDMDSVIKIAKKHNLYIIEDAAEAHGLKYKNKPCGSFGTISIFSFYANKLITTGEGGMIVTDNKKIAIKCQNLRNLYFGKKRFVHEEMGFNYRMTNIQAALGLVQLEQLNKFKKKKAFIAQRYNKILKNISGLEIPLSKTTSTTNVYWVYGIVLNKEINFDAEYLIQKLKENNIGARPFFWPIHKQPVFKKMGLFIKDSYPIAENLAKRGLYIPCFPSLSETNIKRVTETIKEIINEKRKK